MNQYPRRLIEVDLPIKRISEHARREKSIRRGTISSLHIWWARRPLAACRALICAALWPDPADPKCPESFKMEAAKLMKELKDKRGGKARNWEDDLELRRSLLDFIADIANLDNAANNDYLRMSRKLTQKAHESLGGELETRPLVVDPFAGGGSIPLEALRVGADAFASDLNPVAVLLNKVLIEYIPRYRQKLADEVVKWAQWTGKRAKKMLTEFYPKGLDGSLPIAYLWARTIQCEGPSCGAKIPLINNMWLARQGSRSVALEMVVDQKQKEINFRIVMDPQVSEVAEGTVRRGAAICPICNFTTPSKSVRSQFRGRRGGSKDAQLIAIVSTKADKIGRFYRMPEELDKQAINDASVALEKLPTFTNFGMSLIPDEPLPYLRSIFNIHLLDAVQWGDLFSDRQALAMVTLVESVRMVGPIMKEEGYDFEFSRAIQTILALAINRSAENLTTLCRWNPFGPKMQGTFGRQALPIIWDFCETQPFSGSVGDWNSIIDNILVACETALNAELPGTVSMQSATEQFLPNDSVQLIMTDPPYYDLVPYADLSDFFYVWFRRTIGDIYPDIFSDSLTPKKLETVQLAERNPIYKYKTKENYEQLMVKAMAESRRVLQPQGVGVIFFAHKGTNAWEAQVGAMIEAGWVITASWPIDTEMSTRLRAMNSAVLASSIELVCRPRENPDGSLRTNEIGDWRDVLAELPMKIHEWMPRLAEEGVVGADAIFACLGPALEIFSRYSRVEKASGEVVPLKEYLEYVWAAVAKEALNMIFEGAETTGFEEDARLTAMWLWTISTGTVNGNGDSPGEDDAEDEEEDEEKPSSKTKLSGYTLEYDAARKIAQGLGAHLERLQGLVEVKGDKARLLPVAERTRALFGKDEGQAPKAKKKKPQQLSLFEEIEKVDESGAWGEKNVPPLGHTTLDRLHQAMILFAAGRGEALKRFLVEEGAGKDERFWRLGQAFSALYPKNADEKRWVDGVLARKKGLGL